MHFVVLGIQSFLPGTSIGFASIRWMCTVRYQWYNWTGDFILYSLQLKFKTIHFIMLTLWYFKIKQILVIILFKIQLSWYVNTNLTALFFHEKNPFNRAWSSCFKQYFKIPFTIIWLFVWVYVIVLLTWYYNGTA